MASRTIREERHAVGYLHVGVEFDSTLFFLERIIRDSLTRNLDAIQAPMCEEIRCGFDQVFDTKNVADGEWKTINVYDSFQKLLLPVMTRVFFGLSLSRDSSFLKRFENYNLAMGVGTIVIGQLPSLFKSLFVPIFNLPLRYYRQITLNKLVPEVERQLSGGNAGSQGESFISQCARVSAKSATLSSAQDPRVLAEWLMLAGFAAMSSTVIQMSNSLLDILNCDRDLGLYNALRSEAESILKTEADWNMTAPFNRLVLYDSVIRESLRCHPILIKGLTKEVVDPKGLELPDGTHLPKGTWVGVPVVGVHRDERFYPNAMTYDPYRFLRLRHEMEKKAASDKSASTSELDAARPSVEYLGFGYGRHACPGRWFAVLMMKTLLAHLTLHYDVEATGPQPKTNVIGDAALPPLSATISRKATLKRNSQTEPKTIQKFGEESLQYDSLSSRQCLDFDCHGFQPTSLAGRPTDLEAPLVNKGRIHVEDNGIHAGSTEESSYDRMINALKLRKLVTPDGRPDDVEQLIHRSIQNGLSGPHLETLTAQFQENLAQSLLEETAQSHEGGWIDVPDLHGLVQKHVFRAMVHTLFGPYMISLNPTIADDFWEFNRSVRSLFMGLPSWMTPKAHRMRSRMLKSIKQWQKHAQEHCNIEELGDVAWEPYYGSRHVRERQDLLTRRGILDETARAAENFAFMWATNSNSGPAASWFLIEILQNTQLKDEVLGQLSTTQIEGAAEPKKSAQSLVSTDPATLLADPLLQSVYAEVLRLRVAVLVVREAARDDFSFCGWQIQKNEVLTVSSRTEAFDHNIWGTGGPDEPHPLHEFWARRFVVDPGDNESGPLKTQKRLKKISGAEKSSAPYFSMDGLAGSWIPYGGGRSLCPGRHFAKRKMLITTAVVLSLFDVELTGDEIAVVDLNHFGFGTMPPKHKVPARLRRLDSSRVQALQS
ncbi:Cytochrome P466 monooxygenase [Paramyrothecium foliicola]|nr:Cytochrome P466 monooxygenase [Paramyrothecium foliicola]